jgi:predicted nucleotidyltransferase
MQGRFIASARLTFQVTTMPLDEIIASIKANESAIRAEGVDHLAIYGSCARGETRPDSDLDVLVDIAPGRRFSLLNLCGVGLLIEDGIKHTGGAQPLRTTRI